MLAVAVILRVVFAFIPMPRPHMTLQADGLIETKTVEDAQAHTSMTIALPDDLLGSEVYSVGTYTRRAATLPVGSVSITTIKNDWRFVEIVERPMTTLEDVTNDYAARSAQSVALGNATATMLTLPTNNIPCVSPNERWNLPGFCEIARILAFEHNGTVFTIAADGTHASDGELITLAREIAGSTATTDKTNPSDDSPLP